MAVSLNKMNRQQRPLVLLAPHRVLLGWVAVLSLAGMGTRAQALGQGAPFKPPAILTEPGPTRQSLAPAAPSEAASTPAVEDNPVKGLLGIRQGRRSAALIDGEWVDVGQTVRGARLTSVSPQGAQLKHPDGRRELLELNPEARWTPHRLHAKEGRP